MGTYYLAVIIPKGFLPSEDIDQINGTTEAIEGISFDAMVEHQKQIARNRGEGSRGGLRIVVDRLRRPNPESGRAQHPPEAARASARRWTRSSTSCAPSLLPCPGWSRILRNDPPIRIGGLQSKALYQFTMQSPNTEELYSSAQDFTAKMRALPGLTDVSSDLQIRNPQINVEIDRDAASSYGVTVNQIEDAIYSAYGQRQISTIFAPNNQYWVILELEPEYQRDANKIASLYVHSAPDRRISRTHRAARADQRRGETHARRWGLFR